MKKLLAALSAAGLLVGLVGAFGSTAASAGPRPHTTATLVVTVSPSTGISRTAPTPLVITVTGANAGDTLEYGLCNDDASQKSPLVDPTDACTTPNFTTADGSGDATIDVTLTPGKQGSDATSTCPQSTVQYGLGIQCIAAVADFTTTPVATGDAPLYFAQKSKDTLKADGAFTGLITGFGFATDGLFGSSPTTLATGCQSFSGTNPKKSWTTGLPLCDDGTNAPAGVGGPLPKGEGYATGEPVEVIVLASSDPSQLPTGLTCNPTPGDSETCPLADADQPTHVTTPGELSDVFGFPKPVKPKSETYTIEIMGAASTISATFKVTVGKTGGVS
jgi:hypothetical protein